MLKQETIRVVAIIRRLTSRLASMLITAWTIGRKEGLRALWAATRDTLIRAISLPTREQTVTLGGVFDKTFYRAAHPWLPDVEDEEAHYLRHGLLTGAAPNIRVAREQAERWPLRPLISVLLPLFNTRPDHLKATVDSVCDQSYDHWELVVQDDGSTSPETVQAIQSLMACDPRIRVAHAEENGGISAATNQAVSCAKGDFVAMLDHDDWLLPGCLAEIVAAHNRDPEADVFYTDQWYADDAGNITAHQFKPDWSPWFFRGVMYAGHLLVVRRSVALAVGGFNSEYDYVQDFEFMLRVAEATDRIMHIPKALYVWRQAPTSVAGEGKRDIDFGGLQSRAVNAHCERIKLPVRGCPHPRHPHRLLLQPMTDEAERMPVKVFVMSEHDKAPPCDEAVARLRGGTAHAMADWIPLNMEREADAVCTAMAQSAGKAGACAFVRAGFVPEDPLWLTHLLAYLHLPRVGAVGPLLLNTRGRVDAAGLMLKDSGVAPVMPGMDPESDGYRGSLSCVREVTLLSPECLIIREEAMYEGLPYSADFGVTFSLLETCLRGMEKGWSNLLVPYVRGCTGRANAHDYSRDARLAFWMDYRRQVWAWGDPYYNPNLSVDPANYALAERVRPRVGRAWHRRRPEGQAS